jgi:hypothetical protein
VDGFTTPSFASVSDGAYSTLLMVQAQEAFFAVFVANPALAEADAAALVAGASLLEDEQAVAESSETVATAATAARTRCMGTKILPVVRIQAGGSSGTG